MRTYRVVHKSSYEYEAPVLQAHHLARLRPRAMDGQRVEASEIVVSPKPAVQRRLVDYFGNDGTRIEIALLHDLLTVTAESRVAVSKRALAEEPPTHTLPWEKVAERLRGDRTLIPSLEFTLDSPLVRAHSSLASYAKETFAPGRPILEATLELSHRIATEFSYEPLATDISTPLAQVLRERRGVCQDFAHLAVGCLRSFGLAARYVSGYLETLPPEGMTRLVGADASHAWASVFVPEVGWVDFDPTNDLMPSERHIVLGWGRDFSDVSPLIGVVHGGGAHRMMVGVDVEAVTAAAAE